MNELIVIPARGGSSQIHCKPMSLIHGKPLLWYSIDYVRRHRSIENAVVVTDDLTIADYAISEGVIILAEPTITEQTECVERAIYRVVKASGNPDCIIVLQPTQPIRPAEIDTSFELHQWPKAIVSIMPAKTHPFLCSMLGERNRCAFQFADLRQKLPDRFELSGAYYVFRPELFSREPRSVNDFWSRLADVVGIVHPNEPFVDIHNELDLLWFSTLISEGQTEW
jgi:CMP-N,N'-diacetyllegionaminic acid synthase